MNKVATVSFFFLIASALIYADVQIVAHRGASGYAPENSIAAFKLSWELGADAIEADFRLTKDGEIVCIHDETTEKLATENLDVEQSSSEQLRSLRLLNKYDPKYDDQKIPTLSEVLAIVPEGKRIYIELKSASKIVPPLIKCLQLSNLSVEQICVISFDADVIRLLKSLEPKYETALLVNFKRSGLKLKPTVDEVIEYTETVGCEGISVKAHPLLSPDFGGRVKSAGYKFHVWTVDVPTLAEEMRRRGADSITTNYPDRIRQHLLSR